jgi:hypothetical protein
MCWVDPLWPKGESLHVSRRGFLGAGLSAGLVATTMGMGRSLLFPGVAEGGEMPAKSGGPGAAVVRDERLGDHLR